LRIRHVNILVLLAYALFRGLKGFWPLSSAVCGRLGRLGIPADGIGVSTRSSVALTVWW
jgi:hypothetical protein